MLEPQTLQAALAFRRDRNWEQFHTPRNLAMAISVESGELLEHFQWLLSVDERPDQERMEAISQEVADLAILITYFAHDLGIDVEEAVRKKLALNTTRYPIEKSLGNATKYDRL